MLIDIRHKAEGEDVRSALLTIFWTRTEREGISRLRNAGIIIMLPFPTFFKYTEFCTGHLMRGVRLPRIGVRVSFIQCEKRNPVFTAYAWMHPVLKQTLIATREQIEDGLC